MLIVAYLFYLMFLGAPVAAATDGDEEWNSNDDYDDENEEEVLQVLEQL